MLILVTYIHLPIVYSHVSLLSQLSKNELVPISLMAEGMIYEG